MDLETHALRRVDVLVPAEMRTDPERLRTARLVATFAMVLSVLDVVMGLFLFARGDWVIGYLAVGVAPINAIPLATLWVARSERVAGLLQSVLGSLILAGFAWILGGMSGPALFWNPLLVIAAMLASGRRGAVLTTLMQFALLVGFVALDAAGVQPPPSLAPIDVPGQAISVAIVTVGMAALVSLFVTANERMRDAVQERNQELRYVLDNVGQGFLCLDPAGRLVGDRSVAATTWFGAPRDGDTLWALVGRADPAYGAAAELGWSAIMDDVLPLELCLDQMPRRISAGGAEYRVEYRPVTHADGKLHRVVVVVTDVTELLARERAEQDQRDVAAALDHAFRDRSGFRGFLAEASAIVQRLHPDMDDGARQLHTLKGNAAMFGAVGIARMAQELEERLAEEARWPTVAELAALRQAWDAFRTRVEPVVGGRAGHVEVDADRLRALREATRSRRPHEVIDALVGSLGHEPVALPLGRAAAHARALADRLGKRGVVEVDADPELYLEPGRWQGFWAAFVHVVRNAVDHGLEAPEERIAAGKPPAGVVRLLGRRKPDAIEIAIVDDGPGIDWDGIARTAQQLELPHRTPGDLAESLFRDGLSTAAELTDVSGRGVGMGSFRDAVWRLGGKLEVDSAPGRGTRITVSVPV